LNEDRKPPENLAVTSEAIFTWNAPGRMLQTHRQTDTALQTGVNNKENTEQQTTRDFSHYIVTLDGNFEYMTSGTEYQYDITELETGGNHMLGVKAVYDGGDSEIAEIEWISTTSYKEDVFPVVTALGKNIPNPFNPETAIIFSMSKTGNVAIEIYNAKGQRVKSLVNAVLEAGNHRVIWNGKNEENQNVNSGVYFYRMETDSYNSTKKMILNGLLEPE